MYVSGSLCAWPCSARSNAFPLNADNSNNVRCEGTLRKNKKIVCGTICSSDVETSASTIKRKTWPGVEAYMVEDENVNRYVSGEIRRSWLIRDINSRLVLSSQ